MNNLKLYLTLPLNNFQVNNINIFKNGGGVSLCN